MDWLWFTGIQCAGEPPQDRLGSVLTGQCPANHDHHYTDSDTNNNYDKDDRDNICKASPPTLA